MLALRCINANVVLSGIIIDNFIQLIFPKHNPASDNGKRMAKRSYRVGFFFITACRFESMTYIINTINTDIRHIDVRSCLYMLVTSQTVVRGLTPQTLYWDYAYMPRSQIDYVGKTVTFSSVLLFSEPWVFLYLDRCVFYTYGKKNDAKTLLKLWSRFTLV